jgi:hypothetical protein
MKEARESVGGVFAGMEAGFDATFTGHKQFIPVAQ